MGFVEAIRYKLTHWQQPSGRLSVLEKLFAAVFVVFGLLFIFIIPPFQNPDEQMHFYRSYQLSEGRMLSQTQDGKVYGGYIPLSMQQLVAKSGLDKATDPSYKFDVAYKDLAQHHYGGERVFERFPNTAIYTPIAYIPSIIAHWVVSLFSGPILAAVYLARILSLLTILGAMVLVLRLVPFGKWIFFTVGLLPMTIASSASVSADGMTYALSLLLIAVTLRVAFSGKIVSKKWWGVIAALAIAVALVKQAHVALLPILLIIPLFNKHYRSRNAYLLIGGILAVALALFTAWLVKTSGITIHFHPAVQPDLQKEYLLHEPWRFGLRLFDTYFTNNANAVAVGMIGFFGWMSAQMPILFVALGFLVLYLATQISTDDEKVLKKLAPRSRLYFNLAVSGTFLLVLVVISAALYVYWTPVKNEYIMGMQGRYLLPVLPLLLLAFLYYRKESSKYAKHLVIGGLLLLLAIAIMTTYTRFY